MLQQLSLQNTPICAAGKQPQELADFIFGYFLKGKGLMSAVVEVSCGPAAKSVAFCTLHSSVSVG